MSPARRTSYAMDVDPIELPKTRDRLAALGFGPDVIVIKKVTFY